MKKTIFATTLAGALLLTALTTTIVSGSDAGTTMDPLVTKSYVDTKISDLKSLVTETIATFDTSSDTQYKVVYVPNGSTILGGEGTEMILRSGQAVVVSGPENGLVNMTTGLDVLNGKAVVHNNLMIVPREDGRGFKITTEGANVMVRGYYQIVQ